MLWELLKVDYFEGVNSLQRNTTIEGPDVDNTRLIVLTFPMADGLEPNISTMTLPLLRMGV